MRDGFISVAAGTPKIRVADCRYNAEQIFTLMREAAKQGVKVLCLPELCITGYTCGDLFFQDTLLKGAEEGLRTWESAGQWGLLPTGASVSKGENLFPRIDMEKELKALEELHAQAAAPAAEEKAPEYITIDDFNKVHFVTAKILACEAVKKSKKLLCFTLDCGEGKPRQILSGIHEYYEPEELVGKTVVACTNLAPRKMMGLESNGMLISAVKEEPDGSEKLHLIMLDDKVPAGYGLC